jgi:hypothetical protein
MAFRVITASTAAIRKLVEDTETPGLSKDQSPQGFTYLYSSLLEQQLSNKKLKQLKSSLMWWPRPLVPATWKPVSHGSLAQGTE